MRRLALLVIASGALALMATDQKAPAPAPKAAAPPNKVLLPPYQRRALAAAAAVHRQPVPKPVPVAHVAEHKVNPRIAVEWEPVPSKPLLEWEAR